VLAVLTAPAAVALFGLGVPAALVLTVALLGWRWAQTFSALTAAPAGPGLTLDTIAVSHFVEKVRWCLDRLGVEYEEVPDVGVLGVFATGRTVPRLRLRTGKVESVIGDSPDILRYLWGRYAAERGQQADFLRPSVESIAIEARLDRYGVDLQRWVYHHILPHRSVTLRAWGVDDPRLPAWQRQAVSLAYPVLRALMQRAFRLSDAAHVKVVGNIEALLGEMNQRLADGRRSLLGTAETSFVDITFAALSGLWIQPQEYAAGKARFEMLPPDVLPAGMGEEVSRWRESFPHVAGFVERLYREERLPAPETAKPGPGVAGEA